MCLQGDCKIKIRSTGDEVLLREGYSCLIPAAIADYDIIPQQESSKVLDAYINNMEEDLLHKVSRFLHISER
jgi:mannose-6-phosphate isomerase